MELVEVEAARRHAGQYEVDAFGWRVEILADRSSGLRGKLAILESLI